MTALMRSCCCGTPLDCPGTCDFSTSYLITGLSGSVDWEWRITGDGLPCDNDCLDTECPLWSAWSLTASFYQLTPITITRVVNSDGDGSTCCYQGTGTMRINWTLGRRQRIQACQPTRSPVCEINDVYSGVHEVPFCYQVSCGRDAWHGEQGWLHTLSMCSWKIREIDVMVNDCSPPPGDTDCPVDRQIAIAGGLVTSWSSKFASLTALDPDIEWLGWCMPVSDCNYIYPGTDIAGSGTGCMPTMALQSTSFGPMSLGFTADGTTVPDCIDPISFGFGTRFGCESITSESVNGCYGDFEWSGYPCCSSRFNAGVNRATFT